VFISRGGSVANVEDVEDPDGAIDVTGHVRDDSKVNKKRNGDRVWIM
jgi:hypothetical protein